MVRWLLCLGLIPLFLTSHVTAQQPVFRSNVDMVPITVTVTDRAGRLVTDLAANDFAILEDGKARPVAVFERERTATSVAIVMDTSSSMRSRLPVVRVAVRGLLARLRAGDEAALIGFGATARLVQGFTSDWSAIDRALDGLYADGTTSLYDAVSAAADELHRAGRPDIARRTVIVVLSDGGDTSSVLTAEHMMMRVYRSGAVVYTIDVGGGEPPRGRLVKLLRDRARLVLTRLAERSGGRPFELAGDDALPSVYEDIGGELAGQYLLGFAPSRGREGGPRRISVAVKRSHSPARVRIGSPASLE